MANTSFRDSRNPAELLLAPARPASRVLARFGTIRLGIDAKAKIPGQITKITDITGALRSQFGSVLSIKSQNEALSKTLSGSLSSFDANKNLLLNGTITKPDPIFSGNFTGIPSAAGFLQFSALKPGEKVPASFLSAINDRKQQLSAITARAATTFTGTAFKGVTVKENTDSRQPFPLDDNLDLPTTPRLAQGGSVGIADPILKDKRRFTVRGVHIASGKPSFWSRLLSLTQVKAIPSLNPVVNQVFKDRKNVSEWSEPSAPYAAQFPYNSVNQTASGHVIELDDSPGAERIHIFHRAGSFIEFHPNGTVVYKNMKDGYDLTMGDKFVKVSGACHIAVDGNATVFTKGNLDVQADGDINMYTKKDYNVYAQNINMRAKKAFKADGIQVDLRYINLPSSLMPVPMGGGFAPRINITAIKQDFPKSNIDTVLKTMAKNPLDPKTANLPIALNPEVVAIPPDNPLSNPGIYTKKTASAISYRGRLFDAPEETDDFEMYSAHIGLQTTLGDISGDPRALGGKLFSVDGLPTEKTVPTINYLNYDDYKGVFAYANNFPLGASSYVLSDLVDNVIYPDIVFKANTK